MLSTGREFDRLFIAMLIVSLTMLAVYTFKTCNKLERKQIAASNMLDQKVSYVTSQLSDTKQQVNSWLASDSQEAQTTEEKAPSPPEPEPMPMPMPYGS
jgi:5-bromo-4-chloroindolyl phosphate hydrolysis protein